MLLTKKIKIKVDPDHKKLELKWTYDPRTRY